MPVAAQQAKERGTTRRTPRQAQPDKMWFACGDDAKFARNASDLADFVEANGNFSSEAKAHSSHCTVLSWVWERSMKPIRCQRENAAYWRTFSAKILINFFCQNLKALLLDPVANPIAAAVLTLVLVHGIRVTAVPPLLMILQVMQANNQTYTEAKINSAINGLLLLLSHQSV